MRNLTPIAFTELYRSLQFYAYSSRVRFDTIAAMALPDEDLALSAPLAWAWSQRLCRQLDRRGRSCAWFHGGWQYLRQLDLVTTPGDHAPFYGDAFRTLIRAGARRVLVAGCADYAMPAHALHAFARAGESADLVVIDLCETPLRLASWYGARVGAAIATEVADMVSYRPSKPFDIVCTHSILGHFAPETRAGLIAHWHSLLAPGGRVVTVNRIRPDAPATVALGAEHARLFKERLLRDGGGLGLERAELEALADGFIATRSSYPVRSAEELRDLFERGGFRVEALDLASVEGRGTSGLKLANMAGSAWFASLVAVRA